MNVEEIRLVAGAEIYLQGIYFLFKTTKKYQLGKIQSSKTKTMWAI